MLYLLIAAVVSWVLFAVAARLSRGPGDDFAGAFAALFMLGASVILTLGYFGCAFWFHRFL